MVDKKKADRDRTRILRRTLILPYLLAAAFLLPLALIRGCDTRVKADVTVREFAFDLAGDSSRVLVDATSFDAFYTLYRLNGVFIIDDQTRRIETGPEGSLGIRPARLNALQLKPGAHVVLRRSDASSLGISVTRTDAVADVGFTGVAQVECNYCTVDGVFHQENFRPGFQQDARLRLSSVDSQLHLVLTTSAPAVIADRLAVRNPSFRGGWEAPATSLIADGAMTLPDLAVAAIPLHSESLIEFHHPHDFWIDKIDATPQGLHVQMTGWADGVSTQANGDNRLPSLLQRLHANQSLALYGGVLILVAGTIITALRQLQLIEPPK